MSEAERLANRVPSMRGGTWADDAAAELRRLSAVLEECQAQRRAAFRRIEEQDAELEKVRNQMESQKDEWLSWEAKRKALEKDAERYRWLLDNYATGDGYDLIDRALNDGEADTQLTPAIDAAMKGTP